MAKKATTKKAAAPKAAKETKATASKKTKMTAEEKKAKAAERKARMDALPQEQRENSKTIDVIKGADGSKVVVYAQTVRKYGVLITPVAFDAEGNVINVGGTTSLEGYKPKMKKGHGNLVVGTPGVGKGKAADVDTDEDDDDDED